MNKSAFSFLIVIVSLSCNSCSTFIKIQITQEPEIAMEKKSGKIAFVNLFDYTSPVTAGLNNMNLYTIGIRKFNEGLLSLSAGTKPFIFITGDTLKKGTETGQLTALLPMDSVKAMCVRFNSDMMLALDSMNIFLDEEWYSERNDDGSKDRTKQFILYTRFYTSLYSANGDLINRSEVQNRLLYESRNVASFIISFRKAPSIAKAAKEAGTLGFQAGQDFVNKLYPQVIDEYRTIFTGRTFSESNALMRDGNWNDAIKKLEVLSNSSDINTAHKAKQNLSVAREADGFK